MEYQDYVDSLTPDIVDRLRRGIETGRWPDGRPLTPEQREHSLQAVIAWDQSHRPEHERVGYIDQGAKARNRNAEAETNLRWVADPSAGDSPEDQTR